MKILISEKLSEHKYKTPEGYLICTDSVLSRTGCQIYRRDEIFHDGDQTEIQIERKAEEVFSPATLASFENKPICIEHPEEDVNAENYKQYAVGYVRDIKRGKAGIQEVMTGTLVITDPEAISAVENHELEELSCGYDCDIVDEANPQQRNIRGNHIALCKAGRAGIARIIDSVDDKLIQSASEEAFKKNVETEIKAGKTREQAIAIAYSIKRQNDAESEKNRLYEVEYENTKKENEKAIVFAESERDAQLKLLEMHPEYIVHGVHSVDKIEAENTMIKGAEYIDMKDAESYKVYFAGGKYNGKTFTTEEIKKFPEYAGAFNRRGVRNELIGQPVIKGYLGPMWNGGSLRYETQEVYNSYDSACTDEETREERISRAQVWIDYDMKRYGKISETTRKAIEAAGLKIEENDGEYEVYDATPTEEATEALEKGTESLKKRMEDDEIASSSRELFDIINKWLEKRPGLSRETVHIKGKILSGKFTLGINGGDVLVNYNPTTGGILQHTLKVRNNTVNLSDVNDMIRKFYAVAFKAEALKNKSYKLIGVKLEFYEGKNHTMIEKLVSPEKMLEWLLKEDSVFDGEKSAYNKAYVDSIYEIDGKKFRVHGGHIDVGDGQQAIKQEFKANMDFNERMLKEYLASGFSHNVKEGDSCQKDEKMKKVLNIVKALKK